MAEVLGVVSSVVQLIDASAKIIKYVSAVRHAHEDAAKLEQEVSSSLGLLYVLRDLLRDPDSDKYWLKSVSISLRDIIDQTKDELVEVATKITPPATTGGRVVRRFQWPFKEKAILESIQKIARLNQSISLALQENLTKTAHDTRGDTTVVREQVTEIAQQMQRNVDLLQKQRSDQVIQFLAPADYSDKYNDVRAARTPDTGSWFTTHDTFQNWVQTPGGVLWCPGIPGAGKSTMMTVAIDHLQSQFASDPRTAIAYCFCDYLKQAGQNPHTMIASLWRQFARNRILQPDECADLESRYVQRNVRPTKEEMTDLLRSEIVRYSRVFFLVDALDELQSEYRSSLILALRRFQPKPNLLITTRPQETEDYGFSQLAELRISASASDLAQYISHRMTTETRLIALASKDITLKREIRDEVVRRAGDMFLLAELHLNSIAKKPTPKAVRKALLALPQGGDALNETYDQTVRRIQSRSDDDRLVAEHTIAWICKSFEPMTSRELRYALSVDPDDDEMSEADLIPENFVLSACEGLVMVDKSTSIVRFVHFTAQKYFEGALQTNNSRVHGYLTRTCTAFLSLNAFDHDPRSQGTHQIDDFIESTPFVKYSVTRWGDHARIAFQSANVDQIAKDQPLPNRRITQIQLDDDFEGPEESFDLAEVIEEFTDHERNLMHVLRIFMHLNVKDYGRRIADNVKLDPSRHWLQKLNTYAGFGLDKLVEDILTEHDDIPIESTEDWLGNALHWAALGDRESTIRLLLERGKAGEQLEAFGCRSLRPLHVAALHNNLNAAKLLIAYGADVALQSTPGGWTPLNVAAEGSSHEVVKLILSSKKGHGTIFHRSFGGNSALHDGAKAGNIEVVKLLLQAVKAAQVDIKQKAKWLTNDRLYTPLHVAAKEGHTTIVTALLESELGSEFIKAKNYPDGLTAFQTSAIAGHEATVKAFHEWNSVNVSKVSPELLKSMAVTGALYGQSEVLNVLLEYLPDPLIEELGSRLLILAVDSGFVEAVAVVLKKAIVPDLINTRDNGGRTPLLRAAAHGHLEICTLLLDRGCDLEARDEDGDAALHYAATANSESVVKLLLSRQTHVSPRNFAGQTPLAFALRRESVEVARLLLAAGAQESELVSSIPSADHYGTSATDHSESPSAEPSNIVTISSLDIESVISGRTPYTPALERDQFEAYFYLKKAFGKSVAAHLVSRIMDMAEYWIVNRVQHSRQMRITEALEGSVDYVRSMPIIGRARQPVRMVVFSTTSHDQGWSDFRHNHGTYDFSFTWFVAGRESRTVSSSGSTKKLRTLGPELLRNVHASKQAKKHTVCWPASEGGVAGSDLYKSFHWTHRNEPAIERWVKQLQPNDRVCIVPFARSPGWTNFVYAAEITVYSSFLPRG